MAKQRIEEIDFLKYVLITLMVVFHLSWFGDHYPTLKEAVYTFHMPGFLLVAGFFAVQWRPGTVRQFLTRRILWLLIPYAVMEAGYAAASALLPVRDGLDTLSISAVCRAVLLHPVGPYWFLRTLILCSVIWFAASGIPRIGRVGRLMTCALLLTALSSYGLGLVAPINAFYFFFGAAVRSFQSDFCRVFRPHWLWLIPFTLLCLLAAHFDVFRLLGVAIVYCAVSGIMGILRFVKGKSREAVLFIGRNSLSILLFSPLFTMAVKPLIPLFSFDETRLCFMFVGTVITLCGSLLVTFILDKCGMSPYFFGRKEGLM